MVHSRDRRKRSSPVIKATGQAIRATDSSQVEISGGLFAAGLDAMGQSSISISGGTFAGGEFFWPAPFRIRVLDQARVDIYGTDLHMADGHVSGILADGTPLEVTFEGMLAVHEVPEPSAFLLGTASLLAFLTFWRPRRVHHPLLAE